MKNQAPPPANVTLAVTVARVKRLNRRCRLLERQVEILCNVIHSMQFQELLAQVKALQDVGERYAEDDEDERGGES